MDREKDYEYTGYNVALKDRAKELRKNMTEQEKKLWYCFLKQYPIKFVKQRPIDVYIVDFYCSKARLVIEVDGNQHFTDDGIAYDENRTYVLCQHNIKVIRFTNSDIDNNFRSVCEMIDKITLERTRELMSG